MIKKLLCSLLALLLLFSLCACDNDAPQGENSQDKTDEALVPHLGKADYTGKTLRILSSHEDVTYGGSMFKCDEMTGEPINDACYNRLQKLKQAYGFDVSVEFIKPFEPLLKRVKMDYSSGTTAEYDCIYTGASTLASAAVEGCLKDINSIENSHLQLDKEWWDTLAVDGLALDGRLFAITGDIAVMDDEYTYCMFYNKDLIESHRLENPSTLALQGKWTLDQMYTMMKAVALDDGDGKMDVFGEDVWGLIGPAFMFHNLISGCNAPITSRDTDGRPQLAMLEDRNVRAYDKCYQIITDKNCSVYAEQYFSWDDTDNLKGVFYPMFYGGHALFYPATITAVNSQDMRESQIHYGILPLPKLEESQQYYASSIDPYWFACMAIYVNCEDTDFVTFALEALAYMGREMVTPEYYDRTLKNKRFLDDNDSPEVLDIIFSQRLIDQSIIYNWGDCIQYYNNMLWNEQGLASYADSQKDLFNNGLKKTLEAFDKMK